MISPYGAAPEAPPRRIERPANGLGTRDRPIPSAALEGAPRQVMRTAPVVVLFPGANGSAAAAFRGAPHARPTDPTIGPGDPSHDPLACLASLDRSNPEHVRAVVEWLANDRREQGVLAPHLGLRDAPGSEELLGRLHVAATGWRNFLPRSRSTQRVAACPLPETPRGRPSWKDRSPST